MKKRKNSDPLDVFRTSVAKVHIFRAGDVGRILGMEKWRLEKFLTGKQYKISPSGHLGKGHGSWRLFSHKDLYRLGAANLMVNDGFTAKFVSYVLQEIEDSDLMEINMDGDANPPDIGVFRTTKGPQVGLLYGGEKTESYYVLKLGELIKSIDKRIQAESKRR